MPPNFRTVPQSSVLQAAHGSWQSCVLTWYDPALGGTNSGTGLADPHARTASGEPYQASAMTCAAPPQYAFGTMLTFRYQGKVVTCRVNDRGGAIVGHHFDLSRGAAQALGIIGAGVASASFAVGGNSSSGAGGQSGASGGPGGGGGGGSILSIFTDLLTLNLSDLAARLALVTVTILKDAAIGIGDYVIIPAWHWNQRAVTYYQQQVLFGSDPEPQMWTAAFWAFGYWLLWTAPGAGAKPASVRNSRFAHHIRAAQAIPARASLIKPSKVRERTPRKPSPVASTVPVEQVGTMATTRPERVRVHARGAIASETTVERTGEIPATETKATHGNTPHGIPHEAHRAGDHSRADRDGRSSEPTTESPGKWIVTRHRRASRNEHG